MDFKTYIDTIWLSLKQDADKRKRLRHTITSLLLIIILWDGIIEDGGFLNLVAIVLIIVDWLCYRMDRKP